MQRFRESLSILLIGLLPLHAFLVTAGTNVIAGPGHAPLAYLALWKEAVLGLILCLAFLEWIKKPRIKLDSIDWLIIGLLLLSVLVTAMTHGDWKLYLYGFKYDFIPLVSFVILRRVSWSEDFADRIFEVLLLVAGAVAIYGMISMYLPKEWFVWLGYSDLHSLYNPDGPVAAYQQIGGTTIRRIQSTMSGPNQLGLWLIIPLCVALKRKRAVGVFVLMAMFLTFSRSALLAAGVIITILLWRQLPRKKFWKFAFGLIVVSALTLPLATRMAPEIIARAASSRGHITRPMEAIGTIIEHPFGLGLGTAGPASNRVSDTCAYYEEGTDLYWASDRPDLCVFIGTDQIQPIDRECNCPVLPENWYLQMGVEMGVLGFMLYLMLIVIILRRLFVSSQKSLVIGLMFLGISIAALFLHAWEDAAVAYTVWILIATTLHRDQ